MCVIKLKIRKRDSHTVLFLHFVFLEWCQGQFQCFFWPKTCCFKRQKPIRRPEFLFSFRNARLSVPAHASPQRGIKAGLLIFGNSSHPHVNSCVGHWGVYLCVWWLCGCVYQHVNKTHTHCILHGGFPRNKPFFFRLSTFVCVFVLLVWIFMWSSS